MGFAHSTIPALWDVHKAQFPVAERYVYLNHAAVAPLCRPAADAMKHLADDCCANGSFHYDAWLATYDGFRKEAARMIGCDPSEIAISKNTSEGIATVAIGLDWRAGDKVVAFREEFPANYYPWKRLESKGVQLEWLSIFDPLDRIDEACRGAKLLAVSYVNYLNGHRVDIQGIGEICHRRGVFYLLDAIQGLGAFPIDVEACHIDALAADGHKWLLGPEGCAILYVRRGRQDEIEPVEFGWTNVAAYADYASRDMTLRSDAGRYEPGTLNTIGCYGLHASMEFLNGIGVGEVNAAVSTLADRVANGVIAKGYELAAARTAQTASGIVSFRRSDIDSRVLVSQLKSKSIIAAPRQGWVRVSPHFYVGPEAIDRFLAALP